MAAPAPLAHAAALQAAGFAMQSDIAPLATTAQLGALQAQVAALQAQVAAQVAALQAQVAALPSLAQIQATIAAALAPHNAPAVAAAASATVQAVAAARARNAHDERGVAYAVVPRYDGTLPPNWPVGFSRDELVEGPIGVVDTVLKDYGLPHGALAGGQFVRRNALARVIGAPRA